MLKSNQSDDQVVHSNVNALNDHSQLKDSDNEHNTSITLRSYQALKGDND